MRKNGLVLVGYDYNQVENGRVEFFAVDTQGDRIKLTGGEVVERYLREYGAWRASFQDLTERMVEEPIKRDSYTMLNPMVAHLVNGYIEHDDYACALDVLKSAQYLHSAPPIRVIKALLIKFFVNRIEGELFGELFSYLHDGFQSGEWDSLIPDIIEQNILDENGNFNLWDTFRIVLEDSTVTATRRFNILSFIKVILYRLYVKGSLSNFIITSLDDRRNRRRFITTYIMGNFQLSSPEHRENLITIISLIMSSLSSSREHYDILLDELYDYSGELDPASLFYFLREMISPVKLELLLLILERRFRLGNWQERRPLSYLRINSIVKNLSLFRVESRSGVSRDFDIIIFHLLRMLLVGFVNFCHPPMHLGMPSLLDNGQVRELLDNVQDLVRVASWPKRVRLVLRITICCLEKYYNDNDNDNYNRKNL